ncbi:hypothetical protein [Mangrovibacter plantisponsor]|uniref:TIGR04255 family protein n=1 Tax=Mangrovibacter plantisponsor TaxID=451513 RepID=A0A317PIS6_9ENTR|nr:hypothetical protein [Mangrovibacter plantisponsor]PWV99574.1 hypothetical protein DES37_1285 [Mangrovibacter plantisponsor]
MYDNRAVAMSCVVKYGLAPSQNSLLWRKEMKFKLVKQSLNVVWISPIITPLMFSPEWFRRYELLREEDINNSNSNFGPDTIVTDYGWIEIQCSPTKAVFQLSRSGLESALADLTSSIFAMFEHAETKAIGINTLYTYNFDDKNDWENIGNALVPKDLWNNNNNSKILLNDVEYHYGMKNLVIAIENATPKDSDSYSETINVTYAPIKKSDNINYGLHIQYNHELRILEDKKSVEFTNLLREIIPKQINEALKNDINSHEAMFRRVLS